MDYKDRMKIESENLLVNITKALTFTETSDFAALGGEAQKRLRAQIGSMLEYHSILNQRRFYD